MIKAYFFDGIKTLWDVKDVINFKEFLTKEQSHALCITRRFDDFNIGEKKRDILYHALNNSKFTVYKDTKNALNKLKDDGYKLALVSNTYCITEKRCRESCSDIINLFDVVTFSSEVGLRKPDPEIFLYTLKRLNRIYKEKILPEEIMMIGDEEEHDILPAIKLGMQGKLIDRTKQNLKDII
jgi:HAD superfamily hydrolase (TIGR01549 family)